MIRCARLRPTKLRSYPSVFHAKAFPVLDHHPDPTVRDAEGYIWIDVPWKGPQSVWAADFEILTLERQESARAKDAG